MDNNIQMGNAQNNILPGDSKEENSMATTEANLRRKVSEMGFDHGRASVMPAKALGADQPQPHSKPTPAFFENLTKQYEIASNNYISGLKDLAVKSGAVADALENPDSRNRYSAALNQEIKTLQANEFHGKNLVLYIIFAFLLCLGDILLGDYLAKEVLMAGPDAFWKGILLGVFCIALGVVLEIIINNLYAKANKRAFNIVISIIPILTLFMFVGMGVLRSASVNILYSSGSMDKSSSPPWTVTTFFVGLSLAAPTALGCVLFVIQKKVVLNRLISQAKLILHHLGIIINSELLLEKNKTGFAKDLEAEYDIGYQKGKSAEIFKEPPPETKDDSDAIPKGSIKDRLKGKILKKYGFKFLVLSISLSGLMTSCVLNKKKQAAARPDNARIVIFLGLSKEKAGNVLAGEIAEINAGTAFTAIWPESVQSFSFKGNLQCSLMAETAVARRTTDQNDAEKQAFKQRFDGLYLLSHDSLYSNWQECSFRLMALASEQFMENLREKRMTFWLGMLPNELMLKPDSLTRLDARADALKYGKLYSLKINQLAGTNVNIYVPAPMPGNQWHAELIRRTTLYYREMFSMFNVSLLSVKTKIL